MKSSINFYSNHSFVRSSDRDVKEGSESLVRLVQTLKDKPAASRAAHFLAMEKAHRTYNAAFQAFAEIEMRLSSAASVITKFLT